jgi:hypothetical protein
LSIPERIYRLSKAYLGQVRSRIDAELSEAERELDAGKDTALPDREDTSPDAMMQRAQARIEAARREMEARSQLQGAGATATAPSAATAGTATTASTSAATKAAETNDPNASDYRVLGIPVGSDYATVQAAYEKLARRCDPRRFPDGSTEQEEARRILVKVNASYEALKKRLDPLQSRFRDLELD